MPLKHALDWRSIPLPQTISRTSSYIGWERWSSGYGMGFESQHHIFDGCFSQLFFCKSFNVCLKKTENKRKRGRAGPFKIGIPILPSPFQQKLGQFIKIDKFKE